MFKGSIIDELIESVQIAELHAVAATTNAFEKQVTRAQAYTEYLYESWSKGQQAGVA